MWTTLIIGLIIVSLMVVFAIRRGLELRQLVESGIPAKATIISKNKFRGKSGIPTFRLRYQFHAQGGQLFSKAISMTSTEAANVAIGDTINIVYVPSNPKISATEAMVALGRQALKEKRTTR